MAEAAVELVTGEHPRPSLRDRTRHPPAVPVISVDRRVAAERGLRRQTRGPSTPQLESQATQAAPLRMTKEERLGLYGNEIPGERRQWNPASPYSSLTGPSRRRNFVV